MKKLYGRKAFDEHPDVPLANYVYGKPSPRDRSSLWQFGQVTNKPGCYVIRTAKGHIRRDRAQVRPAMPPRKMKRSEFVSFEGFPETEAQSRSQSSDKQHSEKIPNSHVKCSILQC